MAECKTCGKEMNFLEGAFIEGVGRVCTPCWNQKYRKEKKADDAAGGEQVLARYGDLAIVVGWIGLIVSLVAALGFFGVGVEADGPIGWYLVAAILSVTGGAAFLALFAVLGEISHHLAALRRKAED